MAEELRKLRLSYHIPAKDMVAVIKRFHPKFDKTMLSKCEHGGKYGVQIKRDALNALYEKFAPELLPTVKKERDGRHRLSKRISCRLEDDEHAALQKHFKEDGYKTMQDWLTDMVRQYNESKNTLEI